MEKIYNQAAIALNLGLSCRLTPGKYAMRMALRGLLLAAGLWCWLTTNAAWADQRFALVIGSSVYSTGPLPSAAADASDMAQALGSLNFSVTTVNDASLADLSAAFDKFYQTINGADIAVVYFSGFAMQFDGQNWLLPSDARSDSIDEATRTSLSLTRALQKLAGIARTTVVILDASRRNNPLADQLRDRLSASGAVRPPGHGLQRDEPPAPEMMIVYSDEPGHEAEGIPGRNSFFTMKLLQKISRPDTDFDTLLAEAAGEVLTETGGLQRPMGLSRLTRPLYLGRLVAANSVIPRVTPPATPPVTPPVAPPVIPQVVHPV
eukprot:gene24374-26153_t